MFREVFGAMFGAVYDQGEMTIVTHMYPDADAALAAWLLREAVERLGGVEVNVLYEFVPAGQRGSWSEEDGTVFVVDTGGEHDPSRRLFDHHFTPLASDINVSAASLVWEALRERYKHTSLIEWLNAIKPLVDVVTAGDHGRAPVWSYQLGPHALIANIRNTHRGNDEALLIELFRLFDAYSEQFLYQARIAYEASCCTTQLAPDIVMIKDGSSSVTRYVLDELGNALALFVVNETLPNTVAVGIQRATERRDIDTGIVLARMKELAAAANDEATLAELGKWYAHPSGFAAIRGTEKHPDDTPVDRSVEGKLRSYLIRAARELGIN